MSMYEDNYLFGSGDIPLCITPYMEWGRNPDAVRTKQPNLQKIKLGVHKRYRKAPPIKPKFDLSLNIKIDGTTHNVPCKR